MLEFDRDDADAVGGGRADFADMVEPLELILERLGDRFLDFRCIRAGQHHRDGRHRYREVRIDRARNAAEGLHPQQHEQQEHQQRQLPAPHGQRGYVHSPAPIGAIAMPSFNRSTRETATVSPGRMPPVTAMPASSASPTVTRRSRTRRPSTT